MHGPWPATVLLLHWLTALAVLAAFALAFVREWIDEPALDHQLLSLHRDAGMLVWAIACLRLAWRCFTVRPSPLPSQSRIARRLAAAVHGLLYVLLILLPLIGYGLTCARGAQLHVFGVSLPMLFARCRETAEWLETLHHAAGWLLLGLIGMHVAAALFHHFILRDDVLRRMLPRSPKCSFTCTSTQP